MLRAVVAASAVAVGGSLSGANAAQASWGGYSNGYIPTNILASIPWDPVRVLRVDARDALVALNGAFRAQFGHDITINDGYRDFAEQVRAKEKYGSKAAEPGQSNHGWAVAVDVANTSRVQIGFSHAIYFWLKSNAGRFGWAHPAWAEPNGSNPEAWHWEYTGTYSGGVPAQPPHGTLIEAGSALGWRAFAVGSPAIQGTRTAVISDNGGRVVYTVRGGNLWEAGSAAGWNNLHPGIVGVTDVAAISDAGGRVVYTVRDGRVWEAPTATWNNLYTGISGVSDLAVVSDSGGRVVYTLRDGQVWEASTATWNNLFTGISGASRLSVISDSGGRVVYTVRNGQLWEAGSATGWNNLYTGISGVTDVAAISDSGGRVVYTLRDGQVWEAATATWNNLYTGISGLTDLSVISDSGGRVVYGIRV